MAFLLENQMSWDSNLPRYVLIDLLEEYKPTVFVETGTQSGNTVLAVEPFFDEVHTIEVGPIPYLRSRERLSRCKRITCWFGPSTSRLPEIIKVLQSRPSQPYVLFWLDAHYSGPETYALHTECPVLEELKIISEYERSIVLIDDARMFDPSVPKHPVHCKHDWPKVSQIQDEVLTWGPKKSLCQVGDILIVSPDPYYVCPTKLVDKDYKAIALALEEMAKTVRFYGESK